MAKLNARNAQRMLKKGAKQGSKKAQQILSDQAATAVTGAAASGAQRSAKNVVKGAKNVFESARMSGSTAAASQATSDIFGRTMAGGAKQTTRHVDDIMQSLDRTVARGYDFNQIQTNKGQGFFKTIMNNASKVMDGPIGKKFDDQTGLTSFVRGFAKEGGSKFQGNALSRAAQNAGYIAKDAAGEISDINYSKIAKGYMGASVGTRIVTGGGIYKDNQGNTNIAGIPFI